MTTESDTCRKFVDPKLQASGWENGPHLIALQCRLSKGRIVMPGNQAWHKKKNTAICIAYCLSAAVKEVKARNASVEKHGSIFFQILRHGCLRNFERPAGKIHLRRLTAIHDAGIAESFVDCSVSQISKKRLKLWLNC
jgi:hypothetical protein